MKKFLAIMSLIVAFLVIYILQVDFFSWFTIAGVKPNMFIIFILMVGLFAGRKLGVIFGIILGFCLDLLTGRTIGISAILLGMIGFLGEHFDKNFSKESRFTIMLMVMGTTFIYELIAYIYNIFRLGVLFEPNSFLRIALIEVLYNAIIVIIMYPIIQKAGYAIENTFKVKNVLTRYF